DRPTSRIVRISPNPFNSTTTIRYSLAARQHVQLAVYNTFGQKVRVLDDRVKAAGFHTSVWNGRDFSGRNVASGVYFVRLTTQQTVQTHRMLLIR
ncbi:MAG: T9SS type A sorting domain-containing protein, partial [Candidatus Latescibacteria bacterium]|nr:T9SS type A sorting domain-containing protein [Candidatus Latescibacterota bacterium]